MPYYAMEYLLRGAAQGVFDLEVVRGLLNAVSLFPLGSHVMLSDGALARCYAAIAPPTIDQFSTCRDRPGCRWARKSSI